MRCIQSCIELDLFAARTGAVSVNQRLHRALPGFLGAAPGIGSAYSMPCVVLWARTSEINKNGGKPTERTS